jgi:ATP-dependent helicase/nuclease subunit A
VPRKEFQCGAVARIRDAAQRSRHEEYNRLLYVALTRAEDRLLVCGTKPKRNTLDERCWYDAIARGFARLTTTQGGEILCHRSAQTSPAVEDRPGPVASGAARVPAYMGTPPKAEPDRPYPLAPSRPEGVEFGPLPASASPLARVELGADRFQRGQLIHTLLQHLPALPEAERQAAALRFVEQRGNALAGAGPEIADEVMAILRHPTIAPLFGPGSRAEVPLTGVVGDVVVGGLIDRLVVLPDRVLLADFKTNRRPPASVEATPVAYLRQMASYRAVLRTIFSGLPVRCALIWTRTAQVTILADEALDGHEPGVPRKDSAAAAA